MNRDLAVFLQRHLTTLQSKNARFSIRSLSRKVDIPAGRVSEMLSGKRGLSEYYAEKIAVGLKLPKEERQKLYAMISIKARKNHLHKTLLDKEIELLSSWEHFAILNVMNLDDFESDPKWLASRLGLSIEKVNRSLQILEQLSLISMVDGKFARTPNRITTSVDVPSSALRQALKADIEKSMQVLDKVPPEVRDFSSMTMVIDTQKLKRAKKLIENFHHRMSLLLEKGPKTEVYNLNVQFYPVTVLQKDLK